jgi:GMP synthase (glutamine-hydrolysing)
MRILAVIYHDVCGAGVFADEALSLGHELVEWQPADGGPAEPVSAYDAVIAFGGGMQADQDELYPWLRPAVQTLAAGIDQGIPTLGLCLGGQMLARAAGGAIGPAPEAEWGFDQVKLTDAGRRDPLFAGLPSTLNVFQWHSYSFALPPHAAALAQSAVCLQAFRVGDRAWGLQWHPEVTAETVLEWAAKSVPATRGIPVNIDLPQLRADLAAGMTQANREGRELCRRFLKIAERVRAR